MSATTTPKGLDPSGLRIISMREFDNGRPGIAVAELPKWNHYNWTAGPNNTFVRGELIRTYENVAFVVERNRKGEIRIVRFIPEQADLFPPEVREFTAAKDPSVRSEDGRVALPYGGLGLVGQMLRMIHAQLKEARHDDPRYSRPPAKRRKVKHPATRMGAALTAAITSAKGFVALTSTGN